jgi:hypothetical protein
MPNLQEVAVEWNEIDGSKLDVFTSSIQMARDIFAIRIAYMLGFWKQTPEHSEVLKADRVTPPAALQEDSPAVSADVPAPTSASSSRRGANKRREA